MTTITAACAHTDIHTRHRRCLRHSCMRILTACQVMAAVARKSPTQALRCCKRSRWGGEAATRQKASTNLHTIMTTIPPIAMTMATTTTTNVTITTTSISTRNFTPIPTLTTTATATITIITMVMTTTMALVTAPAITTALSGLSSRGLSSHTRLDGPFSILYLPRRTRGAFSTS